MQIYEVTNGSVTLGLGFELKLSESQAEIRSASLQKKHGDVYIVTSQVQFKQGEKITVISGNVSKSLLKNLREISDKKVSESVEYPCIQHVSFGKYNVLDKDGNLLTEKPIKKNEAEKILAEIKAKTVKTNQKNSKEEGKKFDESGDENNDVNSLPISKNTV